jgi:hypothetical protein
VKEVRSRTGTWGSVGGGAVSYIIAWGSLSLSLSWMRRASRYSGSRLLSWWPKAPSRQSMPQSGLSSRAKRWVLAQAKTGSAPLFEPPLLYCVAAVPWINNTMAPEKVEDKESESRWAKTYQVNNAVSRFVVSKSRGHAAGRSSSHDAPGRTFSRRSPTCDIGFAGKHHSAAL